MIDSHYPGRVMALDLGEKRIGVALSDELRLIGSAHQVVVRKSRREDFAVYNQLITQHDVKLLVVGLPIPLGGGESEKTAWVKHYAAELASHIPIPLVFWDESLTTVQAEASLRAMGVRGKKALARVDAVAAALILQNFLDAERNPGNRDDAGDDPSVQEAGKDWV